ncbi:MAG: hypothetical protein EHM28_08425 [Spirochaetaceae bacterium]|nr:MAG: hypothetical protein EHM28_08425 [Spirochaetaceae bacterium]
MDNGNKVRDIFIESKKHFLQDDFNALRKPIKLYDLDEEFIKTKKNKNRFILIVMTILVAVFSSLALVVTYFIQESTKKVSVKIDAFTDLRLKDILDRAKQLDYDYSKAQQEYSDIQKERDGTIFQLKKDAGQKILLVGSTRISDTEKQSRIGQINNLLQAQIAGVQVRYKKLLDGKQQELNNTTKQMDQEDAAKLQLARMNEAILDNQKKLFELQLNDRVTYYEDRMRALDLKHETEMKDAEKYYNELITILRDNPAIQLEIAIDSLLDRNAGEIGFIVDASDVNNIILYHPFGIMLTPGDILAVFDLDYRASPNAVKIGSISVTKVINDMSAACVQTELTSRNQPIRAFNRVIIK